MAGLTDPRGLRVALTGDASAGRAIVMEPGTAEAAETMSSWPRVDGVPRDMRLDRVDDDHGVLAEGAAAATPVRVMMAPIGRAMSRADRTLREVVVDGWRFEVVVELASRAALRERATQGVGSVGRTRSDEIRAVIPGRVLAVSVVPGDMVRVGQGLLIVEAMKMQNEVRAPHDGTVVRVDAAVGRTVEVGDVLVVLE